MVGPEPGLTRDPIQASFDHEGTVFDLVDTPGWMKRTTYTSYDESQGASVLKWRGVRGGPGYLSHPISALFLL